MREPMGIPTGHKLLDDCPQRTGALAELGHPLGPFVRVARLQPGKTLVDRQP